MPTKLNNSIPIPARHECRERRDCNKENELKNDPLSHGREVFDGWQRLRLAPFQISQGGDDGDRADDSPNTYLHPEKGIVDRVGGRFDSPS